MSTTMSSIEVITSDSEKITVDLKIAKKFVGLKQQKSIATVEANTGKSAVIGDDSKPLKLDNVTSVVLKEIVTWLQYHMEHDAEEGRPGTKKELDGDESDDEDGGERSEIPDWDKSFVAKWDKQMLFCVTNACRVLQVKKLHTICCQTIAAMITGKPIEEVREILGIENDYTPDEEAELRRQHAWAHEDEVDEIDEADDINEL